MRHQERCGAGREAAYQRTVEAAAGLMSLSTGDPRGEARLTGHARRRVGAEAFTGAGVEVLVAQTFGVDHGELVVILFRERERGPRETRPPTRLMRGGRKLVASPWRGARNAVIPVSGTQLDKKSRRP